MPLKVVCRKDTGSLTIVGTVNGHRVRQRAQSDDLSIAIEEARQRERFLLGDGIDHEAIGRIAKHVDWGDVEQTEDDLKHWRKAARKMIARCYARAPVLLVECRIKAADILRLMESNGFRCAVSGIPFQHFPGRGVHEVNPWSPSVDRIDYRGGYTPENVMIVNIAVNYARNRFNLETFLTLAWATVLYQSHVSDTKGAATGKLLNFTSMLEALTSQEPSSLPRECSTTELRQHDRGNPPFTDGV